VLNAILDLEGALVDHADVLALPHLAGDDVVELGAGLLAAGPADLPLGALAVHGLQVGEGGARVVEEPGLLQRAALPCHVRPTVSAQNYIIGKQFLKNFTTLRWLRAQSTYI
jgi:hypothetical protein